jgi:ABC-2 type transport system permease protein
MPILSLIIKREFLSKIRNKSFILLTFLSPLLVLGLSLFIGYLSNIKADVKKIAIHDETGQFVNEFKNDEQYHYLDYSTMNLEGIRKKVVQDSIDGVLLLPASDEKKLIETKIEFISDESPNSKFITELETKIANKITKNNYVKVGLDSTKIKNAQSKIAINLSKSSGKTSVKGLNEIKIAVGGALGYFIMMFIIIYGNMVMRSVIEEKTNRIIEIIISSIKPFQLMMGKIIGTSLAGILQFCIWICLGLLFTTILSTVFGFEFGESQNNGINATKTVQLSQNQDIQEYLSALWELPLGLILSSFVIYFLGGYFLFSSFYAAIGAAVDSETDSQQFMMPVIMPLVLAVYVGFFTVINDPNGTVAVLFSMIPLTSPIVMLMRIPFGVPWWQILISITILFVTFLGVVWFAAKIYRVGILMHGKKPTWGEIFRWMRMEV